MSIKLGVIMDPIENINIAHDTTFALLLEAERRGWDIFYMLQTDLFLHENIASARVQQLHVADKQKHWFEFGAMQTLALHEFNIILMRKDPPVDMTYIYATQLLDLAQQKGTLVINRPQALRDFNEKLFISRFPQCIAPTLVSNNALQVREFLLEHKDIICKPLSGMGGEAVFRVRKDDPNINVIIEMLTQRGTQYMMAQKFINEISAGDKRILLINGEPIPYALARFAAAGETRANIAAGGRGKGVALTERERWICAEVGPTLREQGILFAGIDVIGDYLTEINITSPTCLRELDAAYSLNISGVLFDCALGYINAHTLP